MSIIKEYSFEKTKIRVHDDYIKNKNFKEVKEFIISLAINNLNSKNK